MVDKPIPASQIMLDLLQLPLNNTNSIHLNPKASLEKGHMVPSWAEPEDYGFAKPDGTVVLLQNDGTVIITKEGS